MAITINEGNIDRCVARIAARGSIGKEEARALLEKVAEDADEMRRTGVESPVVSAAWGLTQKLRQDAAKNRAAAMWNATIRQTRISEAFDYALAHNGSAQSVRSRMYWTTGTDPVGNASSLGASIVEEWTSVLFSELKKEGLLKTAASPEAFGEIAKAVAELRGIPGAAASADIYRKIAKVIVPLDNAARDRLNTEMGGPYIANATDRIAHTSHDGYLVRRGGRNAAPIKDYEPAFNAWRQKAEQAFEPYDAVVPKAGETQAEADTRFWKSTFDAISTGIHMRTGETTLTPTGHLPAGSAARFEIPGRNLARSFAENRVLKPRSPEAWAAYMQDYGAHSNWYSLMESHLKRSGEGAGLMHFFGHNPGQNLSLIERSTAERLRKENPDLAVKFQNDLKGRPLTQPGVENVMRYLDGSANAPQNEMFATINRTIRAFYDIVYLGGVQLTHAASLISTFPSEARMHGMGTLSALGNMAKAMIPVGLSGTERAERLAELRAYSEGSSRYAHDPFNHGRNLPGYVAATHDRFMQVGGLPYIFDHARAGMREMLANNLARQARAGRDFAALNPRLQAVLRRYGINEGEWDLLRAAGPDLKSPSGLEYLTPSAGLAASADPQVARALSDSLAMYYHDAANHATVTAGVRERALLGGMPGTWQGELQAHLLQFKTWPLAALHQVLGREIYNNLTLGKKAWGVGVVAALSMLGGYLRLAGSDIASGREPRTPKNMGDGVKIAMHSLAQGGGLGLFGDFLFGEADRHGGSFGEAIGGPVIGDVAKFTGIWNRWLNSIGTDKAFNPWPEIVRWGAGHIPFANLIYIKGAFDYMALFHVLNAVDPKWWNRMNREMEKGQGRTMMGYTPGAPPPYGVPGVYLGGPRPSGILAPAR
jgi:hypothetical protein